MTDKNFPILVSELSSRAITKDVFYTRIAAYIIIFPTGAPMAILLLLKTIFLKKN